ncbi:hypothetical protein KV557_00500 [Kitasatospora aureofaciens]|uniref:terpene synthase family protein n=1 Tax=Kitasatospora aureofaciens TaxID=1894 RepID=UPI001C463F8A|nr:hypothetical protein [Kitasatospora aureofaciens]MBV6695605.1 hypothetical protein [Kitasatospora aureofaciens]
MTHPDLPDSVIAQLLSFYSPLTAEIHPDAERMRERTLAWAQQFDLGEGDAWQTTMLALTGATLTAHIFPHATGELGQALSDYNAWGWIPNELSGSGRPVRDFLASMGRWERTFRSPHSWPDATAPADIALREVCLRLRSLMTPIQWERFAAGQCLWLYQMTWEASLLGQGAALSVNDYLAMRIGSVGAYAAASYIDATEGIELSERQWARPAVRAAAEASMLAGGLDNDRYSYLRERDLAVKKHNLFDAIRHDHPDHTFEQAVTDAIAIRDRMMTLYLQLRENLLAEDDDDLRRYLTGLDRITSGNINFAMTCARYLLPDSPHTVTRVDKPSDPSTGPLPYPTIAWWWDHLKP